MKLEELYQKVLGSEELQKELNEALKENKLADFLASQNCEATPEEMVNYLKKMSDAQGQVDDDQLDAVVGGLGNEALGSPNSGLEAGFKPGFQAGFEAGFKPGFEAGFKPGAKAGF